MLKKIESIFDEIVNYLAYVAGGLIFFTFLSISTDVFLRYFFNRPILWVVEISEFALVTSTFLAATWVLKSEAHVSVDVALNMLKPKNRAVVGFITSILGAIICLFFTWWGVKTSWYHFQEASVLSEKTLAPPLAPLLTVLPIGFSLLSMQFVRQAHGYLRKRRVTDEEQERRLDKLIEL